MNVDLTGRRALVCGSTAGIGKAIAEEFAASGASVILMARNTEKLESVRTSLDVGDKAQHDFIVADFANPDNVAAGLDKYLSQNKGFDIVVNNTGGPASGRAIDAEPNAFLQAFKSHLICNQIIVTRSVPYMKDNGYGRIINIISTSVKQPLPNLGVSNTIRGAVGNWSKTLANELGGFGITVNNILPGMTETERLDDIVSNRMGNSGMSEEEVRTHMLKTIPAGRFGKAVELAYAAAFLASDKASYINGTNIVIDGGRTGSL